MSRPVLAHRVEGKGEPVLLLNGGLMSMAAWDPVSCVLEKNYRVVLFDFRGQLLSPGRPPTQLGGHLGDVIELLDILEISKAHLVGTSFGAEVALLLAACHPERTASLAAVTATEYITPQMWADSVPVHEACRAAAAGGDGGRLFDLLLPGTFSARFKESQKESLAMRRQQIAALPSQWFEQLEVLLASLEGLDLRPHLQRIKCPTLVVAAGEDGVFPIPHARALAKGIECATLEIVENSGHALIAEQPGRLAEVLSSFLASIRIQGGTST